MRDTIRSRGSLRWNASRKALSRTVICSRSFLRLFVHLDMWYGDAMADLMAEL